MQETVSSAGVSGSIPGSGRSPGEGHLLATYSGILVWEVPWTEESGGLQSMGLQESDMT